MNESVSPESIVFKVASDKIDFDNAIVLFKQYASTLEINLEFQNFSDELNTIAVQYNKPKGALILAYSNQVSIGCAAIREFDDTIAELKRMYVRDEFRGLKVGVKLLEKAIEVAKNLSYRKVRLDTLPSMKKAQELYRSFGFYEIPAYRFNPVEGTVYMEKELK